MNQDYGLISKFVKEDEEREKRQKKEPGLNLSSRLEALKNLVNKFNLPDNISLDVESEENDSLKLKEGLREKKRKKEELDNILKMEK